jgi:hypothetical protein
VIRRNSFFIDTHLPPTASARQTLKLQAVWAPPTDEHAMLPRIENSGYQRHVSFDLGDVGEFINDNPQIPIAAGLMAGQAVHKNVQRAREDAAAIKKGLDAIKRQNDEARRLALDKEQREKALADNRDFLFQLSISLDRILGQDYSLAGYFEIEDLAHDLKARHLTTASFADYRDKEVLAAVESKLTEAKQLLAQGIDSDSRAQIAEVVRWDYLGLKVRHIADFAHELRDNEQAQEASRKKLIEVQSQKALTLSEVAWSPSFLIPAILAPVLFVVLIPLFLVARNPESAKASPVVGALVLSLIPLFVAWIAFANFLMLRKARAQEVADKASRLTAEGSTLQQKHAEIERYLSASQTSVLNIRGVDPDTLSFAASLGITQEQRGKLIEECDEYICTLLGALGVSASALPTIRRLRDLHPA